MIEKLVGHSNRPLVDWAIQKGTKLRLEHDTENEYSSKAIAVKYGETVLGYVGEKGNENHDPIFNALPIIATVHTISRLKEGEKLGKFKVDEITHLEFEFPMASDMEEGIKSFNEPDVIVEFDPVKHKYTYKGTELMGGTTYIKKWIKEFDTETIAGRVADSLGAKKSEVKAMWSGGGDVAAHLGTVVDEAITHYEKFKGLGNTMQEKKDLPFNKALPSHPYLRKVVEEFIAVAGEMCEVETQVIVTNVEKGLCGTIDRLLIIDQNKKICRVQDYKVHIDSEKEDKDKFLGQFADLPNNKLSKYQLQMSFYARLLELAGWTVAGVDAWVYEDKWKRYPMEVLKLDF